VRLTILLPALALEAPGATPSRALADTKGQALRILALLSWQGETDPFDAMAKIRRTAYLSGSGVLL
jgi:hypothetical protein